MEEIFTREEWSNFLYVRRSHGDHRSETGGDCYSQHNQKNDQPEMREMQRIPFDFRSKDSQSDFAPGDINRSMDRNTMKMYTNGQPAVKQETIEYMLIQSKASSASCRSYQMQAKGQTWESISEASSNVFTKPVEVLDNSVQMSLVHSNRKREHSSGTRSNREPMRRGEREGTGRGGRAESDEGDSSVNTGLQTAESTNKARMLPLLPRSALQSSAAHDSEWSTSSEMVIKKRKLGDGREHTRRVRFAEQPEFLPDVPPFEFNAPERSDKPSLPAWILALKGKTKRKPQY